MLRQTPLAWRIDFSESLAYRYYSQPVHCFESKRDATLGCIAQKCKRKRPSIRGILPRTGSPHRPHSRALKEAIEADKEDEFFGFPVRKRSLTPSLFCIPENGAEMTGCSCAHEKMPDQVAVGETLRQVERDS
jgi:hypothetical protein